MEEKSRENIILRTRRQQINDETIEDEQSKTKTFTINSFTVPMLIVELLLSLLDFSSDFWSGYSLLSLPDKVWGIASLAINWIPGVIAIIQIIANHRCDRFLWTVIYSIACLIMCPLIPTLTFLYLLYKIPRNTEKQVDEVTRQYNKFMSFATIVRALEGCLESPLQLLYKLFLMFNGIINFDFAGPVISIKDLHGNNIRVPFFINFLISIITLLKSVYSLNMPTFKIGPSSKMSDKFFNYLDYFGFITSSTIFRLASLTLLLGYFNLFALVPIALVLFFGACINFNTIRNQANMPDWILVFMNLFVPICFSIDDSEDISKVQARNLKLQNLNTFGFYGLSLIVLGLLVYHSKLNMSGDIPINFEMFLMLVSSTILIGALSVTFSLCTSNVTKPKMTWKYIIGIFKKILRMIFLIGIVITSIVLVFIIPFDESALVIMKSRSEVQKVFKAKVLVPMNHEVVNATDFKIIKGEDFSRRINKVLATNPKGIIILNNQNPKPSSPKPFYHKNNTIPTILVKREDSDDLLNLRFEDDNHLLIEINKDISLFGPLTREILKSSTTLPPSVNTCDGDWVYSERGELNMRYPN